VTRSPKDRVDDIRAAIAAIAEFEQDGGDQPVVFDAVRMRLPEIGAAANGIPVDLRDTEPGVPWGEIIGMRNWMAHRYFDTAHAYIWSTVDHDLQPCSPHSTDSKPQSRTRRRNRLNETCRPTRTFARSVRGVRWAGFSNRLPTCGFGLRTRCRPVVSRTRCGSKAARAPIVLISDVPAAVSCRAVIVWR